MKKFTFLALVLILLEGCSSIGVKQIGKINMISNRNVDPSLNYVPVYTHSELTKREIKKNKFKTIEEAVDYKVSKVPGGEFMMNVKIYKIGGSYIGVDGDVWGEDSDGISYKGLTVGDQVMWKAGNSYKTGTLRAFKDTETGIVETETGKKIEKKIDKLSKSK